MFYKVVENNKVDLQILPGAVVAEERIPNQDDWNVECRSDYALKKYFPRYHHFIRVFANGGNRLTVIALPEKLSEQQGAALIDFLETCAEQKIKEPRQLPILWFDIQPPKGWLGREIMPKNTV